MSPYSYQQLLEAYLALYPSRVLYIPEPYAADPLWASLDAQTQTDITNFYREF